MIQKFVFTLSILLISITGLYSQNTTETPDTSQSANPLSIPTRGGSSTEEGTTLSPQNLENKEVTNPLEIQYSPAPAPEENNKMEEVIEEEMEASPEKSEPVPGAEIMIEQEPNHAKSHSPEKENKGKKKKKPNK